MARELASTGLPHPLLVDVARTAIAEAVADGDPGIALDEPARRRQTERRLLRPVDQRHRRPAPHQPGSGPARGRATGRLHEPRVRPDQRRDGAAGPPTPPACWPSACGAEAALVVNNGAAAVLLVLAALAAGREVIVSRGELVEIGGGFRIPEVLAASGARLVEVGTTNRTRPRRLRRARRTDDTALMLKVHASNYRITGFTEVRHVAELADLAGRRIPVVVDLGSGLLDAACPWLDGGPPDLAGATSPRSPDAAAAGAGLVTFSGDKLLGGPQAGIIAGRADLVERCRAHPLARALRPGGLVLEVAAGGGPGLPAPRCRTDRAVVADGDGAAGAAAGAGRGGAGVGAAGEVVECQSTMGGGTLPGRDHPVGRRRRARRRHRRASAPRSAGDRQGRRRPNDLRPPHRPSRPGPVAKALARRAGRSPGRRRMRVIATAGHVDHGKSTLVWALTGTDPDRWAEEKARGLTIDLGFASTTLPSGQEVGFVDVPGPRPVRQEHAGRRRRGRRLPVRGGRHRGVEGPVRGAPPDPRAARPHPGRGRPDQGGGLDDDERRAGGARSSPTGWPGTFLADAEMVPVDVPAGIGLDELRAALDRLVAATPAAVDRGRPRLWVDRSFAVRGAGTVVTGTLAGGRLAVDDEVVVEPGGHPARIRGLQSHHRTLDRAEPGRRLAVNLAGVSHHDVDPRARPWSGPGSGTGPATVDASLRVLASVEHPVTGRGAFAAYIGSGDYPVRLRVLGAEPAIEPGDEGLVRLWLGGRVPLPLLPGDRYVLRELGRGETVGGGEVLDVDPSCPPRRAAPSVSASGSSTSGAGSTPTSSSG